jgi:hypothetical protein
MYWLYSIYYYFLIYLWDCSGTTSTITDAIYWPIYQPWMIVDDNCGANIGINNKQGKSK